jgi:hypothetical protein
MSHAKTKAVRRMWATAHELAGGDGRTLTCWYEKLALLPGIPVAVVDLSRLKELVEKAVHAADAECVKQGLGNYRNITVTRAIIQRILGPLPPQRGGTKRT